MSPQLTREQEKTAVTKVIEAVDPAEEAVLRYQAITDLILSMVRTNIGLWRVEYHGHRAALAEGYNYNMNGLGDLTLSFVDYVKSQSIRFLMKDEVETCEGFFRVYFMGYTRDKNGFSYSSKAFRDFMAAVTKRMSAMPEFSQFGAFTFEQREHWTYGWGIYTT